MTALIAAAIGQTLRRTARVDDAAADATALRLPDMRIDINSASAAELSVLPGLGDRLAQRIVEDRAARGRFAMLDDLTRVSGVGRGTIDRLRPYAFASWP